MDVAWRERVVYQRATIHVGGSARGRPRRRFSCGPRSESPPTRKWAARFDYQVNCLPARHVCECGVKAGPARKRPIAPGKVSVLRPPGTQPFRGLFSVPTGACVIPYPDGRDGVCCCADRALSSLGIRLANFFPSSLHVCATLSLASPDPVATSQTGLEEIPNNH